MVPNRRITVINQSITSRDLTNCGNQFRLVEQWVTISLRNYFWCSCSECANRIDIHSSRNVCECVIISLNNCQCLWTATKVNVALKFIFRNSLNICIEKLNKVALLRIVKIKIKRLKHDFMTPPPLPFNKMGHIVLHLSVGWCPLNIF